MRQYLQWQAVPLSGGVPASDDERAEFETARKERQRAGLDHKLTAKSDPPAAPMPALPVERAAAPAEPARTAPALWKDDSLSRGPRKTFAPSEPAKPRSETLEAVRTELGDCKRCGLCDSRKNIVFGVGSSEARIMFVGEAPGFHEDVQGEPFVGKAGELLDKMVVAMTLSREQIYIANVLKCRPPNNRDPAPDEVATCSPFLERQVAAVQPEVIVALGKFAANLLSGHDGALGRIRGQWQEWNGVPLMPTYHPAYLLRNPADKGKAWDDLKKVMERLELDIPDKYR